MGATNTNTAENAESERFVERGEENGIPFVLTEKGYYPNIVKIKYVGDKIPDVFKEKPSFVEEVKTEETPVKDDFLSQFDLKPNSPNPNPKAETGFIREV